jgi:hypothetical protein
MLLARTPPAGARLRAAAAAALAWLAIGGAAAAQPAPVARVACGAYEAVPSGRTDAGQATRLGIQKNGRLMVTVSDQSITRVECAAIDGAGTSALLVSANSGGAHCCETLHVWALGDKPQKLLEYRAGNAAGYELRDLDGDGRMELVVGDDAFAYFGDLCYACSPSRVPMVLCRSGRGFEDCTGKFPDVLRRELSRFTDRLVHPAGDDDRSSVEGAALGALAVWSLLGEADSGLDRIRRAVNSDEVMKWIERARPQVRDWMASRGRKVKDGR